MTGLRVTGASLAGGLPASNASTACSDTVPAFIRAENVRSSSPVLDVFTTPRKVANTVGSSSSEVARVSASSIAATSPAVSRRGSEMPSLIAPVASWALRLVIGSAASGHPTAFAAASGMASTMGELAIDSGPVAKTVLLIVSTRFTHAVESGTHTAGSELSAGVGSGAAAMSMPLPANTVRRDAIVGETTASTMAFTHCPSTLGSVAIQSSARSVRTGAISGVAAMRSGTPPAHPEALAETSRSANATSSTARRPPPTAAGIRGQPKPNRPYPRCRPAPPAGSPPPPDRQAGLGEAHGLAAAPVHGLVAAADAEAEQAAPAMP